VADLVFSVADIVVADIDVICIDSTALLKLISLHSMFSYSLPNHSRSNSVT